MSERLAHSSVRVTAEVYSHAIRGRDDEALSEIQRLRNKGATLRGIAATLNGRKIRTRRGTPWRLESVARVVKQQKTA